MRLILQIKKNKLGRWPYSRDENGKVSIFKTWKAARECAQSLGARVYRIKRIDRIKLKLH